MSGALENRATVRSPVFVPLLDLSRQRAAIEYI